MLKGGIDNKTRMSASKTLTPAQRKDLMAFLASLTPDNKPCAPEALVTATETIL
jgi:hypothetical protein